MDNTDGSTFVMARPWIQFMITFILSPDRPVSSLLIGLAISKYAQT